MWTVSAAFDQSRLRRGEAWPCRSRADGPGKGASRGGHIDQGEGHSPGSGGACPDEVTSARAALALKRNGVTRVRLLQGGLTLWTERKFPIGEFEGFVARAAST